jgi:hypothetical protein
VRSQVRLACVRVWPLRPYDRDVPAQFVGRPKSRAPANALPAFRPERSLGFGDGGPVPLREVNEILPTQGGYRGIGLGRPPPSPAWQGQILDGATEAVVGADLVQIALQAQDREYREERADADRGITSLQAVKRVPRDPGSFGHLHHAHAPPQPGQAKPLTNVIESLLDQRRNRARDLDHV